LPTTNQHTPEQLKQVHCRIDREATAAFHLRWACLFLSKIGKGDAYRSLASGVKRIEETAEAARVGDRNHFEALVPRIYELGGKLPDDMKEFHDMSACPPACLPADPTDVQAILGVAGS
jgi:hypothetical protein